MLIVAAGTLLGAIVGSFVATIAVRWPAGRSVARGRSACDRCGAAVPAPRLVPLVAYVAQRGRAACCGAAIDPIHPIAELAAATIGALAFALAATPAAALAGAAFGWLLLALALLDARHFWLPDRLNLILALAGLAAGLAGLGVEMHARLIGGAAAFLLFAGIRHGYRRLRGRDGMGGGDVKLFGAIGLWLGWRLLPVVLLGAAVIGLAWSLVQMARGRPITGTSSVPFGTCLAPAAWGGWIMGTLTGW